MTYHRHLRAVDEPTDTFQIPPGRPEPIRWGRVLIVAALFTGMAVLSLVVLWAVFALYEAWAI